LAGGVLAIRRESATPRYKFLRDLSPTDIKHNKIGPGIRERYVLDGHLHDLVVAAEQELGPPIHSDQRRVEFSVGESTIEIYEGIVEVWQTGDEDEPPLPNLGDSEVIATTWVIETRDKVSIIVRRDPRGRIERWFDEVRSRLPF
jgi:hypothetical protein